MGLLVSRLWRRLFGRREVFKVCMVGLNNAGKTTTLFKLHLGEVVETQPTIGSNVEEVKHNNVHMQVWDLGGQESLRSSWTTYYTGSHALILVVDSTDKERLPLVRTELLKITRNEELVHASLLVLANKQDLRTRLPPAELSQILRLHEIQNHNWHIQPCCALTGQGLDEALGWLTRQLVHK